MSFSKPLDRQQFLFSDPTTSQGFKQARKLKSLRCGSKIGHQNGPINFGSNCGHMSYFRGNPNKTVDSTHHLSLCQVRQLRLDGDLKGGSMAGDPPIAGWFGKSPRTGARMDPNLGTGNWPHDETQETSRCNGGEPRGCSPLGFQATCFLRLADLETAASMRVPGLSQGTLTFDMESR